MKSIFLSLIVLSNLLQLTTGIACGQESVKLSPLLEQSFAGTDYGVGAIAQESPDPVPVPVPVLVPALPGFPRPLLRAPCQSPALKPIYAP